jgi:hypothetical protein
MSSERLPAISVTGLAKAYRITATRERTTLASAPAKGSGGAARRSSTP